MAEGWSVKQGWGVMAVKQAAANGPEPCGQNLFEAASLKNAMARAYGAGRFRLWQGTWSWGKLLRKFLKQLVRPPRGRILVSNWGVLQREDIYGGREAWKRVEDGRIRWTDLLVAGHQMKALLFLKLIPGHGRTFAMDMNAG